MMELYLGFSKERSKNVLDFFNEQVTLFPSTNGGNMKVGDLCTCVWSKELLIYLGEGVYGFHTVVNLKTGEQNHYQRDQLQAVKKCP